MTFWYVAYGSNMLPERLSRYLDRPVAGADARPAAVAHAVYFAGISRQWSGGVAFLDVESREPSRRSLCAAYPMGRQELQRVLVGENGIEVDLPAADELEQLAAGEWAQIQMNWSSGSPLGKYNAVLRLPDIGERAAYTITTDRTIPANQPGAGYLDVLHRGLAEFWPDQDAASYWAAASQSSKRPSSASNIERT